MAKLEETRTKLINVFVSKGVPRGEAEQFADDVATVQRVDVGWGAAAARMLAVTERYPGLRE